MGALPEISLGTAALIVFGVCVGYIFLRGLLRTFISTGFLLVSAWVGFQAWQYSPGLAFQLTGKESNLISTGLPVLAGIVTFFILRKIAKLVRSPIPESDEEKSGKKSGGLVFRLFAAVVPTLLISLVVATFVRHGSVVAEIQNSLNPDDKPGLATQLSDSISATVPDWLLEKLDPVTSTPRLQLVKAIISRHRKQELAPVIDPETGQPYPRAIIVDDPELTSLVDEGRISTLLRHPSITEALKDPSVLKSLGLE